MVDSFKANFSEALKQKHINQLDPDGNGLDLNEFKKLLQQIILVQSLVVHRNDPKAHDPRFNEKDKIEKSGSLKSKNTMKEDLAKKEDMLSVSMSDGSEGLMFAMMGVKENSAKDSMMSSSEKTAPFPLFSYKKVLKDLLETTYSTDLSFAQAIFNKFSLEGGNISSEEIPSIRIAFNSPLKSSKAQEKN